MYIGYESGGGSVIRLYSNNTESLRCENGDVVIPNTLYINQTYLSGTSFLRNTYIYSGNEGSSIGLYFPTPFTGSVGSGTKSAIIAEPVSSYSKHHLIFCVNGTASNSENVSSTVNVFMRLNYTGYV